MQPCGVGGPLPVHLAHPHPPPPPPPIPDSLNGPQSQGRGGGSGCSLRIFRLPAMCGSGTPGGVSGRRSCGGPWGGRLLAALSCDRAGDAPDRGQSHVPSGLPVSFFWAPGRQPQLGSGGLDDARERRGPQGSPQASAGSWGLGATLPWSHAWVCRRRSPGASGCPGRRVRASGLGSLTSPWLVAARQTPPAQSSGQGGHVCVSRWTQPPWAERISPCRADAQAGAAASWWCQLPSLKDLVGKDIPGPAGHWQRGRRAQGCTCAHRHARVDALTWRARSGTSTCLHAHAHTGTQAGASAGRERDALGAAFHLHI